MEFFDAPTVDDLKKAIIKKKKKPCDWEEQDIFVYASSAADEVPLESRFVLSTDENAVGKSAKSPYYYKGMCLFIRLCYYYSSNYTSGTSK